MYLLNRDKIHQAVNDERSGLQIGQFDDRHLQHTWYYFRLGQTTELQEDDGTWYPQRALSPDRPLTIEPQQCVRAESLEDFALNERYFAILGGTTDMALAGLSLLHGPSVDPHFPRPRTGVSLKVAIANLSRVPVTLPLGHRIGKITFFEISDTYPVPWRDHSLAADIFRERGDS